MPPPHHRQLPGRCADVGGAGPGDGNGMNVMKGDRLIIADAHFDKGASQAAAQIVADKL